MISRSMLSSVMILTTLLCGCSNSDSKPTQNKASTVTSVSTAVSETISEDEETGFFSSSDVNSDPLDEATKPIAEDDEPGILKDTSDISLHDVDGENTNFHFTYGNETFKAVFKPDNWQIIDSYKINSVSDMEIICQALIEINPIHGSDMVSYRSAADMAYEWKKHNIAYAVLPDNNKWKSHAKDVDLDPDDQDRSIYEIYKDRTETNE